MEDQDSSASKFLSSLIGLVLTLYLMTAAVAGVYFNWQYAQQNGFVSWVLFGEVVPTLQAAVWPYYAIRSSHGGTSASTAEVKPLPKNRLAGMEVRMMIAALNASQQAALLINSGHSDFGIREYTNIEKIVEYRRQAADIGRKVNANVLNDVYPELGTRFKNDFCLFLDTFLKGYETGSDRTIREADQLNDHWADWYDANQKAIQTATDKALGPLP